MLATFMDKLVFDVGQAKEPERVSEGLEETREEVCCEAFFLTFVEDNMDIKA